MTTRRLGTVLLGISMALYCVIGFTGFDPVRQDEAYIFGIILEYWRGQQWVVPLLAGVPYMEKPPLYYLIGAATAQLFSPWLPLHDAARLSSALLIAITTGAIAAAGRLLWGVGYGRFAALALLSSIGLAVPAHMMLTDNAQLSGIAIALLGFAAAARNKRWAGLALGTGAGVAFLSKGLLGPGIVALSAILLLIWPEWRRRSYALTLLLAASAALPWLGIWPLELYRASPALFADWLLQNNFGRFFGYAPAHLNAVKDSNFWYSTFWWASFPLLPLALLSLRRFGRDWQRQPALQIGMTISLVLLAVLSISSTLRAIYALPLLPALALIAAPVLRTPPRWVNRVAVGGGRLFFIVAALLTWSLWLALAEHLIAPQSPLLSGIVPTDLQLSASFLPMLGALTVTIFWFICQWYWRNQDWRGGATWYSSLFSVLALLALLWLPACEQRSSYRPVFEELADVLTAGDCVDSWGLGESQRGMLDYIVQVKVLSAADPAKPRCENLLIDSSVNKKSPVPPPDWSLVWSGKRSPDAHEEFLLYTHTQQDIDASEIASSSSHRHKKHGRNGLGNKHGHQRSKV